MPRREAPWRPWPACTTASSPRALRPLRSSAPNEPRASKRWRRENPCAGALGATRESLDGDALAALGAARVDDGAAAGRLHAHAKAVRLLPVRGGRLESALHGSRFVCAGKAGNYNAFATLHS